VSEQLLRRIRESQSAADFLSDLADFELLEERPPDWFTMASGEPIQVIGRDGAGGRFCLCGTEDHEPKELVYVDTEGRAGTIGNSLAEGMQLMVALPYWRDCLKFSGGGNIVEMRKAQGYLEAELRQRHPDIETERRTLYRMLGLAAPPSPLESLHRAVTGGTMKVVATSDGTPFEPLFNTFVAEHNSMWRKRRS
jgi:hypothetical protein